MERNGNVFTFVLAILGAVKLVTDAFGVTFINDEQINAIANLVAVIATVAGITLNHSKSPTVSDKKIDNINTFTPKD